MALAQNIGEYGYNSGVGLIQYGQRRAAGFTPITHTERISDNTAAGGWRGEAREVMFMPFGRGIGADYTKQLTPLFTIAAQETKFDTLDCLTIYLNIMRLAYPAKEDSFRGTLRDRGYVVVDTTPIDQRIWYHSLEVPLRKLSTEQLAGLNLIEDEIADYQAAEDSNHNLIDIEDESLAADEISLDNGILGPLIGIYFNLITKKLNLQNINPWYHSRVKAYSKGSYSDESMEIFMTYKPNLQFADGVISAVSACHELKRMIFYAVKGLSSDATHFLNEPAKITMVYFSFAELTSFGMALEWVLAKNPVLLTWNGLAKHLPSLKAAVEKFRSIGEDAPYCKLIYPPEQLNKFKYDNIGLITNVAYDIAIHEGKTSLLNYKGAEATKLPIGMSQISRAIVSHYSGALTHQIAANRREVFHSISAGDTLLALINSSTDFDTTKNQEDDSKLPVPGSAPVDVN